VFVCFNPTAEFPDIPERFGWIGATFCTGFFGGGCCAIADSDIPAKIDANENIRITRVDFLIADTPPMMSFNYARLLAHIHTGMPRSIPQTGNSRHFLAGRPSGTDGCARNCSVICVAT
jgi:hypothetical protein